MLLGSVQGSGRQNLHSLSSREDLVPKSILAVNVGAIQPSLALGRNTAMVSSICLPNVPMGQGYVAHAGCATADGDTVLSTG